MTLLEIIIVNMRETLMEKPLRTEKFEMQFSNGIKMVWALKIYQELIEGNMTIFPKEREKDIPKDEFVEWVRQNRHLAPIIPFPISESVFIGNSYCVFILSPQLVQRLNLQELFYAD